jgi:hypothetical protein
VQANDFRFCAASAPLCTPADSGYTLTVPAGTEVTWVYADNECDIVVPCPGHNVTFTDVAGKTIKSDGATLLSRVFTKPGTYDYFCSIHQSFGMTGTVVVEAAPASATAGAPAAPPSSPQSAAPRVLPETFARTGSAVPQRVALGLELLVAGWLLVSLATGQLALRSEKVPPHS